MFTIDFTKPWLYKDITYFNQGNLSTNNTLRCKLVTGGSDDFTGGSIACTFTTKDSVEIDGFGKLIDAKSGIVDIVIPSNALVVGVNKLEILVNRLSGGTAQSPTIKYEVWQGLTTGSGVEAETNYPILIELINSTNEVSNTAKEALNKVNSMKVEMEEIIDFSYRAANNADIAARNANYKIDEVDEKIKDVDRALAAGTKDLEVKEARKDANGVVHDTLDQRLKSDLIIGDKSLKDFVVDMNGMKETQDIAYETNTGYKVCNDTQVGVVKDLKLSGKSVNNLFKIMSFNFTSNNLYMYQTKELRGVTVGKNITLVNNTPKTIMVDIYNTNTVEWVRTIIINKECCTNVTLTSNEYVHTIFGRGDNGWANNDADKELLRNTCIVLDGNIEFNDTPNKYFEGIASVGNSKGLEVSTVKIDGNLFEGELKVAHLEGGTNIYRESTVNTLSAIIKIHCGGTYHCKCEGGTRSVIGYFKDKPKPGDAPFKVSNDNITVNDSGYLVFYMTHQSNVLYPTNIMVNFGDIAKPYVDHKEDKKPILFKDIDGTWKPVTELRGVNLSKCDTIEEHNDGKYYRHERILKTLLDGTEQWNLISTATSDTVRCYVLGGGKYIPNDNKNILADKISKYDTASLTDNCIGIDSNGNIVVGIKKSELTTQDVEGVKAYIAKNNITLLSVMLNEKVYEVNPLELESFDNATMWLIFSGVIAPPVSFKITSSLPNFIKNIEDRVSRLEEEIYKMNLANFAVALNTLDVKARLEALESTETPIN